MRLLADENLNNHIFRSLLLQRPGLDIVRVQDVGLSGKSDPEVLAWAITKNRTIITQDILLRP
jgi:predicted nuclease of predicted toxin-antitoxin system